MTMLAETTPERPRAPLDHPDAPVVAADAHRIVLAGNGLHKRFGSTEALRGIDFQLAAGEMVAVMGASGSGRSTLLHCLAAILRPDAGKGANRSSPGSDCTKRARASPVILYRMSGAPDLRHGVVRTAQLERAHRLQVLQLEEDLASRASFCIKWHQRSAQDHPAQPLLGRLDL